ncbi:MAG: hypothetical protein WCA06_01570 [Terrimicrobiaceae bacterium]
MPSLHAGDDDEFAGNLVTAAGIAEPGYRFEIFRVRFLAYRRVESGVCERHWPAYECGFKGLLA